MAGDGWRGDGRLIYYSLLVLGGRRYEDEDEGGLGRRGGLGGRRRGSDEEETSLARSVLSSARRYQLSNGGKWENGQMGINVLTIANANVRGPRQAITKVTLTLIGKVR